MKTFAKIFLWISVSLLISCEEEQVKIEPIPDYVLCGTTDEFHFHRILTPSLLIEEQESGCLRTSGTDSLDIDADSDIDITFTSIHDIPDFNNECCDFPDDSTIIYDCWPTGIKYRFSVILDTSIQISVSDNSNISCFSEGDKVDGNLNWKSNWLNYLNVSYFPPPVDTTGNWRTPEDRYMGIRKIGSDTIYGWIKMNVNTTIEVKEIFWGVRKNL